MVFRFLLTTLVMVVINAASARTFDNGILLLNLRCEYLVNPSGIDVVNPRLSWVMQAEGRGKMQTAYQVIVSSKGKDFDERSADLWNSGKIKSSEQKQIKYAGKRLTSRARCYWKVRVWDEHDRVSDWSDVSSWSIGLLRQSDWKGAWIGDTALNLPHWSTVNIKPHSGFHSRFVDDGETMQSVTVDLGTSKAFSSIRMYPASPGGSNIRGYLFPVRFIIESSDDERFTKGKVLLDNRASDFANPGDNAATFNFEATKARYVRLTVTKQSESSYAKKRYGFAIAEMQVLQNGTNMAKAARVIADEPIANAFDGWGPDLLTDGELKRVDPYAVPRPPMKPATMLRKEFTNAGNLRRATIYISTLGVSEVQLNGKKVGDQVLAPEWTDYHKRVQYQTYDVTQLLNSKENVIAATLADGWYIGPIFTYPGRGAYGYNRRLRLQLELEYDDGKKQTIASDDTWKLFDNGPLRFASIFDGEIVDLRSSPGNWTTTGYDHTKWRNAVADTSIHIELSAQMNEPVRVIDELRLINARKINDDTYIYDFGQNMVGWCLLKVPDYKGEEVRLRYVEVLKDDGTIYRDNLRGAAQTDVYTGPVASTITYEPRFTYHGFRYVEVKGLKQPLTAEQLIGRVVASSASTTGSFECSNKDLNQLWKNIWWTQIGNMHSVPTDCPQRDERAGWMGDAQVFSETGIYNMDMAAFFTKWVRDIRDSQSPEGAFGDFSPNLAYNTAFYNAPGWADAGVIVPWRLYEYYGDKDILRRQYDAMKKFIDNVHKQNPQLLWRNGTGNAYGDWLNGNTIKADDYPKTGGEVPFQQYATAFFAYSTGLLAKTALVLGNQKDHQKYKDLYQKIRSKYANAYLESDGSLQGNTQASYALALSFGLIDTTEVRSAAAKMADAVKAYDYRVSTGIQSTIRLMNQLTEHGYNEMAYRLIESDRFPSWLYSIRQGATTIWERWDGYVKGRGFQDIGMNSFNHYAIGAVGEWMYKVILGIRPDTSKPGFNRFIIQPQPGGTLTHAKGSYRSVNGLIETEWNKRVNAFELKITVPPNTTAIVNLPKEFANAKVQESGKPVSVGDGITKVTNEASGQAITVQSGKYHFIVAQ